MHARTHTDVRNNKMAQKLINLIAQRLRARDCARLCVCGGNSGGGLVCIGARKAPPAERRIRTPKTNACTHKRSPESTILRIQLYLIRFFMVAESHEREHCASE